MSVVAVIQARMGSTRLPGKVMSDIGGRPMLAHVVERARATVGIDEVIVATSTLPGDLAIARLADERGWRLHRGSEDDVLDRTYQSALEAGARHVVRITSDCPLYCPIQGARVVRRHVGTGAAYTHNLTVFGSGMPLGTGAEAFTLDALEVSWREGLEPHHREHVDEFVCEHPERFRHELVLAPPELARPGLRLTVDTPEDLALVREIYNRLGASSGLLDLREVVALLDADPILAATNRHVRQKTR